MANTSIAIQPYLPSCTAQLVPTDYQSVESTTFQPGNVSYYMVCAHRLNDTQSGCPEEENPPQDLWKVWLPGAVLGGIAVFAAACFLVWLLTLCCRPHAYTYQLEWLANSPFYSSSRSVKIRFRYQHVVKSMHAGNESGATTEVCSGSCCWPPWPLLASVPGASQKPSWSPTTKCHAFGRWWQTPSSRHVLLDAACDDV